MVKAMTQSTTTDAKSYSFSKTSSGKTSSGAKARRNSGQCEEYRDWHRTWSKTLYSFDFDLVEYTFVEGQPKSVGYFEYKHVKAPEIAFDDKHLTIMAVDARAAGRPAFFVRYDTATVSFRVLPLNGKGEEYIEYEGDIFTERAYVQFLHALRGDILQPAKLDALDLRTDRRLIWPDDQPPYAR